MIGSLHRRIDQKGPQALSTLFRNEDHDNTGLLGTEEFKRALLSMNLGPSFTERTVALLVDAHCDEGTDGLINYEDFTEQLRGGSIKHKTLNPVFKHRVHPDPERPLGSPRIR